MSFLTLSHVSKVFPKSQAKAVDDFSLDVQSGEFISFLGPSGCGKTTTLRMIAGFEIPTNGQIRIGGDDLTLLPPNQRNVGMVFQSYALFPNMTVAQNVGFGLKVRKAASSEIAERVNEMLALVHLEGLHSRYPYQLSGGQQQRVALARALAIQPQVLLLDEPLSALDAKIRVELRQEVRRIQQQLGITTIYVTHDQEEALSLSDRVVVMNRGRIEHVGTPFEVYSFPRTAFTASFIGQLNLLPAQVLDPATGACTVQTQVVHVASPLPVSPGTMAQIAVRPEELSLIYNGAEPPPHLNHLRGMVDSVTFLGAIVRVRLAIGDATSVDMDLFNDRQLLAPKPGDWVQVVFSPQACWLVEDQ